ncbi:MAG TPA: COX15/CtaA family protein [Longimicrobiales bacterium]|nr:COX15/CtaA family protein [Longimicrobiales bacterium]
MTQTTAAGPDSTASPTADWRLALPERRRRHLRGWLWSVAAMTLGVLIVGGITRLTQSGLSIVDWDPIMGVIPPLDEAAWQESFERYRQFPEYQKLRAGMTLGEFQGIYFWEYLHRLLARGIGLVFLAPFAFFLARGYFARPLLLRALALFGLGAAQGVMGWLMVASGLVDRPSVSHYRLAAHLALAFLIFGYSVRLARELAVPTVRAASDPRRRRLMTRGLAAVGVLFALQVVWGAFVAGLKAGRYHNTFPLMEGRLVPPTLLWLEPPLLNFVQNPITVQWVHRVLGTLLALAAIALFVRVLRAGVDRASARLNLAFFGLMVAQYALGVLTLIRFVPVSLAVAHQATAMVMFGVWVWWWHHVRNLRAEAPAGGGGAPGRELVPAAAGGPAGYEEPTPRRGGAGSRGSG